MRDAQAHATDYPLARRRVRATAVQRRDTAMKRGGMYAVLLLSRTPGDRLASIGARTHGRWLRWRWLLSRAVWREFDATPMPTAFGGTTALAALVAVGGPPSPPELLYLQWMRNRRAFRPFKERVWVAGEGSRVVVATLGPHGVRESDRARSRAGFRGTGRARTVAGRSRSYR
jgi:hypothetical protein